MITIKNYVRPKSLEEAWTLNQKKSNRIIGGMLWMRMSKYTVSTAIDLCDLGLNKIEETEDEISIGAMVTLRDIEKHEGLNRYTCNAVRKAVEHIVGVQFRNMATVGGSVWGRFGFSDVLTMFLAMDAYVELYKGGIIPLSEFNKMEKNNDILVRLIIKKAPAKFVYTSMRNQVTDFPVIAVAIAKVGNEYRAVIGARPSRAMLVTDSDGILKDGINEMSAKSFAKYVSGIVPVSSNTRASAQYRKHLVRGLVERCVNELGGM